MHIGSSYIRAFVTNSAYTSQSIVYSVRDPLKLFISFISLMDLKKFPELIEGKKENMQKFILTGSLIGCSYGSCCFLPVVTLTTKGTSFFLFNSPNRAINCTN